MEHLCLPVHAACSESDENLRWGQVSLAVQSLGEEASVAAFVFAGGAAGRGGYDRLRTYPCTGRSSGGCISSLLARTQPG